MSPDALALDAAWREAAGQPAAAGEYRAVDFPSGGAAVRPPRAAIDAIGRRHLLLPVRPGTLATEDRLSAAVQVLSLELQDPAGFHRFADLVCHKADLDGHFAVLAAEVLERLGDDPDHPDQVASRVLSNWRDLLRRAGGNRPAAHVVQGLMGELMVLKKLSELRLDAVRRWTGPDGGVHDFTGSTASIEVKTSRRRHERVIEVTGFSQLEPVPGTKLYLMFYRLEEHPSGQLSLDGLVNDLIEMGVPSDELWERLGQFAIDRTMLDTEDWERFRTLESLLYRVDETFPRIVPGSFAGGHPPAGVIGITYLATLSGSSPSPLPPEQWSAALGSVLEGMDGAA